MFHGLTVVHCLSRLCALAWCINLFWIWNSDNIWKIAKLSPVPVIVCHLGCLAEDGVILGQLALTLYFALERLSLAIAKLLLFPVLLLR